MHISSFMGPVAFGASNDLRQIDLCLDLAARCADAGLAMVTFGEQHFNGYEPYSNPFLMAARLSTVLGDTWFGTTVVPLPFHHPLRLAEEANITDLLLRGRFVLGMSQGRTGPVPDWRTWGLEQSDRDEIFRTKLDFFRRAVVKKVDDPPIVMDTPWDRGELAGRMMPLSWRLGGPQIAIGSSTDTTIEDTGRQGLPLFMSPVLVGMAAAKLQRHRAAMAAAGVAAEARAHASRLSMITLMCVVGETDDAAWESAEGLLGANPMMDRSADPRSLRELSTVPDEAIIDGSDPFPRNANWVNSWLIAGGPDTVAARIAEYEAAGFAHVNLRFTAGSSRPDLVRPSFDTFIRHVVPLVDSRPFPALRDDEIEPAHTAPPPAFGPGGPGPRFDTRSGPGGGDFGVRGGPGAPVAAVAPR